MATVPYKMQHSMKQTYSKLQQMRDTSLEDLICDNPQVQVDLIFKKTKQICVRH